MSINYFYLILALALLWMPRHWLRGGRRAARKLGLRRRRSYKRDIVRIRESGDNRVNFAEEFGKPRNYVDFLRAFTGGLLLLGNADWAVTSCFETSGAMSAVREDLFIFEIQILIIAIGVIRQFVRMEGRVTFYAPLFYFAGLSLSLCGVGAGMSALLLVWTLNAALPIPPVGFLTVYAVFLTLLGLLFQGIDNRYVYATGIMFILPVVISLMARRSLALFNKKIR